VEEDRPRVFTTIENHSVSSPLVFAYHAYVQGRGGQIGCQIVLALILLDAFIQDAPAKSRDAGRRSKRSWKRFVPRQHQ
jgi:hypothetical protein